MRVLSEDQIVQTLCRLAAEQGGMTPAEVTLDSHLVSDLNFDSLDQVEYAMQIEDAFEVSIPDDEAADVKTVRQAFELLCKHLETGAQS
jgi:acyl carrier protein